MSIVALPAGFHAVALSEEVTGEKPFGTAVGDQRIVLWRDKGGIVHALEDRCPHRRAPLSLGCIRSDGHLQCGYHGWSFDGTGKVIEVPQMRRDAKLPAVYRAEPFSAVEQGGFVFAGNPQERQPTPAELPPLEHHGMQFVALDLPRLHEILLDGPQLLLAIPGVQITEYPLADPELVDGAIVYERGCRKRGGFFPDRLRDEFPLALRIALEPARGLCRLTLRDADYRPMLEAVLALTPARRGATAIRWRAGSPSTRKTAPLEILEPAGAAIETLPRNCSAILDVAWVTEERRMLETRS